MQIGDRITKLTLGGIELDVAGDKKHIEHVLGRSPGTVTVTARRRVKWTAGIERIDDIFATPLAASRARDSSTSSTHTSPRDVTSPVMQTL